MASINKVILIGHLGKDPEVRTMSNGKVSANVSLATSESWKDKNTGEKHERTEWHNVVFFSPLADIVGQYLRKGSLVYIEGRLQTRKWQDKNGQDRYTTEIIAKDMKMIGGKPATAQDGNPESDAKHAMTPQHSSQHDASSSLDDDIPFC